VAAAEWGVGTVADLEAGAQWMAAVPLAGQAAEVMAAKLETVAAAVAAELRQ